MKYTRIWFCLCLTNAASPAQEFLNPLVVTASRSDDRLSETPYTVAHLDAEELADTFRRTVPEALQYTPGVLVQKTSHGHGSPFIRGFTGRQNLLLVDGVRVNNSTFRSGPIQYWNTVDSQSVERLELIKSQGSVLYGSDAIGGTLNALTKSSRFRDVADGQTFSHGSTFYEYRSNGQGSHLGRLETDTGVGGKFGVFLGLSFKEFGDIEDSAVGRMRGTGYPEQDLDLKFTWAVTSDSTLTFAQSYLNQDGISRWHRTRFNPGWEENGHVAVPGLWNADTYDQERSLTYLRYEGENPEANPLIKRWSATLSYQSIDDSEFQDRRGDPGAGARPIRNALTATRTTGIDLHLESPVGPGTLIYGVDFYHDDVDSSGYQTNAANSNRRESLPVADDSEYDLFGAFMQYQWKPVDRFSLTGGVRHTYAKASLGRFYNSANVLQPSQADSWDATVGSLRARYRLNDRWNVYAGIGESFRAPNLDDLSGNLIAKSGVVALGSANLEPEHYLTYEIGTRYLSETWSMNAAVFYTDVEDLIVGVPTVAGGGTTVATNDGEGYVYGVEMEGSWTFHPQWTLSGFAAWQDGRTKTSAFLGGPGVDRPNTRSLPLSGSVALRWTAPSTKYWIEGRVLAASQEDRISAADQASDNQRIPTHGTPGYIVTSIYGGWHATEWLDVNAGIENVTDEDYRSHGSGQNEPGINAIVGVKMIW
jgi:hemoglobin/transferrin/lactoferrin receptor protein